MMIADDRNVLIGHSLKFHIKSTIRTHSYVYSQVQGDKF